jgi:hypothetical protein
MNWVTRDLLYGVKQAGLNDYSISRLAEYAVKIIVDYQTGFRMNSGKVDSVHILR